MGEEASTVRLVRCPKCENLLPELPEYSVYKCGGCGALLRGKQATPSIDKRALEKSDNESGMRVSDKVGTANQASTPQIKRGSDVFGLDGTKCRSVQEKVSGSNSSSSSRTEKREGFMDSEQSRRRRLDFDRSRNFPRYCSLGMSNESQETRNQFGSTRPRPASFHRNASVVENGRFGNLPYLNEGPSNSHLSSVHSFGGQLRNSHGLKELSRVEDVENDRTELLKKLEELKDQLSRSCNVANIPNGRSTGLYDDVNGFNHHPAHRNFPNEYLGYEDAYRPQVLQRPTHQMSHQPSHRQYLPPAYHDRSGGYSQEPTSSYHRGMFSHQPSCACSQCYNMNWQQISPKGRHLPASVSREPYPVHDPLTYGPPPQPRHRVGSLDLSRMTSGDLDLGNGSFGRRYPRRRVIISRGGERVSHPISGGAPFIACRNCLLLLKIPRKLMLGKKNHGKMKCGGCSALVSLSIEDKRLIVSVSSPVKQQKLGDSKSNRSFRSSQDYDNCGYDFQLTDSEVTEQHLPSSEAEKRQDPRGSSSNISEDERSPDCVLDNSSPALPDLESNTSPDKIFVSQDEKGNKSQLTGQETMIVDDEALCKQKSSKDASVATEIDVSLNEYLNCDVVNPVEVRKEDDQPTNGKGNESFFTGLIRKRFRDFSRSSRGREKVRWNVSVNGQILTDRVVKKAEKLAGPIQPGEYWYDYLAGFWGVMNQPCLGIIPPFIEEFNYPMPENCAAGNTRVFVNGRELNQKDLDRLSGRGLPTMKDKSYIIDISGKVVDEDTGEELDSLGKLAPTVERVKHGFGMKVPQTVPK